MSEQLYTQRHNKVCGVIHWHICRNFNIPVPENSWKHEAKAITENKRGSNAHVRPDDPIERDIENKAL